MSRGWSVGVREVDGEDAYHLSVLHHTWQNAFWSALSSAYCALTGHRPYKVCNYFGRKDSDTTDVLTTLDISVDIARTLSPDFVAMFEED